VRCLYVDLDGTLLGAGGAVTRDGEGGFTLLGIRALQACHRAGVLVCAMSGRPRAVLHDDVRLLGLDDYVFEAGGGFAIGDELHWLAEPDTHERIAASGAPDLLLERYGERLEPHTPYSDGREVSHILRGQIDVEEARALLRERWQHTAGDADRKTILEQSFGHVTAQLALVRSRRDALDRLESELAAKLERVTALLRELEEGEPPT
jgi:hydroxymethylpyrimidine pyrophosphatase-like HAD family hydrolase